MRSLSINEPQPRHSSVRFTLNWILVFFPIGYLWFRLIDNLHVEWNTNPQYGYGWLVPLLCLGLIVRRWHGFTQAKGQWSVVSGRWSVILFTFLAFLYLPTRLIEAATPEWRPIQWLLGVEAVGLTLCAIGLGKGRGWLRQLAFPIAFFFVAIPWPSIVEAPIIQNLTRMSAAIVIELLGWLGVPALAHGNVIEISTGVVGINEACSGIRSLQSSLMISLFLGEFYGLKLSRRLLLIPLGFVFSIAFNVGRMSLLTLIAAKKGVAAISHYHDPAGITITILCTLGLWGLAAWMGRSGSKLQTPNSKLQGATTTLRQSESSESVVREELRTTQLTSTVPKLRILNRISLGLLIWLGLVEISVHFWYANRESHLVSGPAWSMGFPNDNPTLKDLAIDEDTRYLLRFDEGRQAAWKESDGTQWQGFYFSWLPGRVAGYLAKRHTPEICLVATGRKLLSGPELTMVNVHGVELPIRSYVFETGGEVIHVFHCRWEAGAGTSAYVEHESGRYNLVRAIWAGRGNKGQKVLEFVVYGMDDSAQIKEALVRQLDKLIKVEKTTAEILPPVNKSN